MKAPEWALIRAGKIDEVLEQIRQKCERQPDAAHITELGIAYLWVKDFPAAWDHFNGAISRYHRKMEIFYGMAGTARWCLQEPRRAAACWRSGLDATHAAAAGLGISMPLLLYFASIIEPVSFDKSSAEKLLESKAGDRRINVWKGPIAKWILRLINDNELRNECAGRNEDETAERHWLADFYAAVAQSGSNAGSESFQKTMNKLADTSGLEWENERFFFNRIWKEEFFLARFEGARSEIGPHGKN